MRVQSLGTALTLDRFWHWLQDHHNCIVRAGTPDTWLFDQDDFHWHLYEDRDGKLGVQLLRGKQLVGDMLIHHADVAYVDMAPSVEAQGQFEFQLLGGPEKDMYPLYHFVMAHGYEEVEAHHSAPH